MTKGRFKHLRLVMAGKATTRPLNPLYRKFQSWCMWRRTKGMTVKNWGGKSGTKVQCRWFHVGSKQINPLEEHPSHISTNPDGRWSNRFQERINSESWLFEMKEIPTVTNSTGILDWPGSNSKNLPDKLKLGGIVTGKWRPGCLTRCIVRKWTLYHESLRLN